MTETETMRNAARVARLLTGDYDREDAIAGPVPGDGTAAEVLVLPGASADALAGVAVGPQTQVLAPRELALDARGARVVAYDGGVGEDEELVVDGGLVLAVLPYTTAAFVPLTCPTVLAIGDEQDLRSFAEDADAAVATGVFADVLAHPLALLGDTCALGAAHDCGSRSALRVVVDADGVARPSLGGAPLDGAGAACRCLDAVVDPEALAALRAERPWLTRR